MLVSAKNRVVLLPGELLPQLQQVFPKVGTFQQYAVVPHTVESAIVLRNLGHPCPAPIEWEDRYDWPIYSDWDVMDHQVKTSAFLTVNPRAFCLNDMGTGKTLAGYWAADHLMREGVRKRALVCAPLSTLERVHADTLRLSFLERRSFAVLHGTRAQRAKALRQPHDFYIINHDGIETILPELMQRPDIDLLLLDEGAVYRNATTRRWKVMQKFIRPDMWVWSFTGAPTPNEPTDAYAQAKLVNPRMLSLYPSFRSFRTATMLQTSMFSWRPKDDAWQTVLRVLQPSIRYTRDECLDLPECTVTTLDVDLTEPQRKAYKALLNDCLAMVNDGQVTALNEANKLMRLVQVVSGVVYDVQHKHQRLDCAPRLALTRELIEATPHKVIVFVPFKGNIAYLEEQLGQHYTIATVNGDTPVRHRDAIFDAFQHREDPAVLVAHPECMAHGLTLTEAATIIWWAPIDSYDIYEQANARINRKGQQNRTTIYHLSGTKVERDAYRRLAKKEKMQGLILEAVAEARRT